MRNPEDGMFCVGCGLRLVNEWEFCPKCGSHRVSVPRVEVESAPAFIHVRPDSSLQNEIKALIDAGNLEEAEFRVNAALRDSRDLETLVVAADVLSRRFKVNETTDLLDEALKLSPSDYLVHIRRAEHFGRLGLYPKALEDLSIARRHLPSGDLTVFMYCQEIERLFRDRSRGSFVTGSSLPRLPSLRIGRGKRKASPSPEAGSSNGRF